MRARTMIFGWMLLSAATAIAQDAMPVTEVAPGAYLLEMPSKPKFIGSNVGWVIFEDYVLVIDAGFAPGARVALDEIRRVTDKPVRFVLDTHHHPDHAFGNGVFVEQGATIVCHEECQRIERGDSMNAKYSENADAGSIPWKTGTLTFRDRLVFDDGTQRVEVLHFGHAHTPGDAVAWLPRSKVLFTGDACVNGPFNYFGDADSKSWARVLERLTALGATTIAPGHGKIGDASVLALQARWISELRDAVRDGISKGFGKDDIANRIELPWYREWTGVDASSRTENIAHVFDELTGILPPNTFLTRMGITPDTTPLRSRSDWKAPKKVLVHASLGLPNLAHVAPGVELIPVSNPQDALSKVGDADAILGFCTPELLEKGVNLKWVQVGSAGVERYVGQNAIDSGRVILTNAQRIHGPPIAEHVFAMTLAVTRGMTGIVDAQRTGIWNPGVLRGDDGITELGGKTLFVVGLGGIGQEVARIGAGLGMRVLATKRTPGTPPDGVERLGGSADLKSFAAESDVIVNCLPLTDDTRGIFDAEFFAASKPGAIFVNIGRGKSVVTADLVAALTSKRLGGAALDVTDPEPLPAGHELWKLDNVVVSPHVSADSDLSDERALLLFRENLRRFAAGEALLNVVDPKAGY